jgi:co-chaperonin GroES (HSP10)
VRAKLRDIAQAAMTDPKQALIDAVGDISGVVMAGPRVLVATYIEPEKTKGGIIRPDNTLAEGRFQGKVGLVLSMGPLAFKDDTIAKFGGFSVKPGDWVVYRASDGFEMFFVDPNGREGTPCRVVEDQNIIAKIDDAACIW